MSFSFSSSGGRESFPIFFGRNWTPGPRTHSSLRHFGDGTQTPLHMTALAIKHQMHARFPMQSTTSVTMTFTSTHHAVLEGALEFCLPPRATVVGYSLDINGQLVDGVVVEKEKARIAFEAEVRKGVDPGLVEIVAGNIFRTRVYPMMPKQSRTVQIRYQDTPDIAQGAEGDVLSAFPVLFHEPLAHLQLEVELLGGDSETEPRFAEYPFDAQVPKFAPSANGFRFEHSYFDVKPSEDGRIGTSAVSILLPKAASNPAMVAIEKDPTEPDLSYFAISYRPPKPQLVVPAIRREVVSVFQRPPPLEICILWDASLSRSGGVQAQARKMEIAALEALLKFHLLKTKVDIHLSVILFRHIPEAARQFDLRFDGDVKKAWLEVEKALAEIEYDGATNLQGLKKAIRASAPADGAGAHAAFYLFTDGLSTFSSAGASEEANASDAFHTLFAPFPAPVFCFNASPSTSGMNAKLLRHLAESSGGLVLDSSKIEALLAPGGSDVEDLIRQMATPRWGFLAYVAKPLAREGDDVVMSELGAAFARLEYAPPVEDECEADEENSSPEGMRILAEAALPPKPKKALPVGLSDLFPFASTTLTDGRILIVGKLRGSQAQELTLLFGGADGSNAHEKAFALDPCMSTPPTGMIRRLVGSEKLSHYSLFPALFSQQGRAVGLQYSLVGEGSSLIVLETLAQHIEHKIAPPASRPDLLKGYQAHFSSRRAEKLTDMKAKITKVEQMFATRSDWYDRSLWLGSQVQSLQQAPKANTSFSFGALSQGGRGGGPIGFGGSSFGGARGGRGGSMLSRNFRMEESSAPSQPSFSFGAVPSMAASMAPPSAAAPMRSLAFSSSSASAPSEKRKRSSLGDDGGEVAAASGNGPSIVVQAYDSKQPYMKDIKAAKTMPDAYKAYLAQRENYRTSPSFMFDCASFFLSPPAELLKNQQPEAAEGQGGKQAPSAAGSEGKGSSSVSSSSSSSGFQSAAPPKRGFFDSLFGRGKTPVPAAADPKKSAHYRSNKGQGVNPIGRAYGIRILSNIVELQLNEPQLLRICAYKLQEFGELEIACEIFSLIKTLRPDEPQSYRDLALCLEELGRYEVAASLLNQVLVGSWDARFDEIEVIAAHELNILIGAHGARLERYQHFKAQQFALPEGIPSNLKPSVMTQIPPSPRLHRFMPCDLCIVLVWDTNDTDVDLHVHEPSGEEVYYGHRESSVGGMISRDFRQGYGPEVYYIAKAPFGQYKVSAKYFANHQQSLVGATTLMVHIYHYWGTPHEEKEIVTLRLSTNQDIVPVCEVTHGPPVKNDTLESVQAELAESKAHVAALEKEIAQLRARPAAQSNSTIHEQVGCDGCSMTPLQGNRYKCMICSNTDLCEACASKSLVVVPGHSPAHPMIRFTDSRPFAQSPLAWNRDNYVHQVSCSLCFKGPIVGYRYLCACGITFCDACEISGRHDLTHVRSKILSPQ